MSNIIIPAVPPAESTVHAARLALWSLVQSELPAANGMADVELWEGEPDQLPTDGVWLGEVRVDDRVAALGRGSRTESAEIDLLIWVSRDSQSSLSSESRAWLIRDTIRAIVRNDQQLSEAANLWAQPAGSVLNIGIAPSGGARCALITFTVEVEIRS